MTETNPARTFAACAILVAPVAFVAAMLLSWDAGALNATLIAIVPGVFAAGFFGALYLLARVIERSERRDAVVVSATNQTPDRRAEVGATAASS